MAFVDLKGVSLIYRLGKETTLALADATFGIDKGEFIAVVGPPTSNKQTMAGGCSGRRPPFPRAIPLGCFSDGIAFSRLAGPLELPGSALSPVNTGRILCFCCGTIGAPRKTASILSEPPYDRMRRHTPKE